MSAKTDVMRVLANCAEALSAAEVRELIDEEQATSKSVAVALSVLKAEGKVITVDDSYPAKYLLAAGVAKTLRKAPPEQSDDPAPARMESAPIAAAPIAAEIDVPNREVSEAARAEAGAVPAAAIEVADIVHHGPTGEDWVVARVTDQHVWPSGYPPCRADLADCTLVEKATPKRREEWLAELRKLPASDERAVPAECPPAATPAFTLPDPAEQATAFRALADRVYGELKANGVVAVAPIEARIGTTATLEETTCADSSAQCIAKKLQAVARMLESWPEPEPPQGLGEVLDGIAGACL
jgi:hypothetical protein